MNRLQRIGLALFAMPAVASAVAATPSHASVYQDLLRFSASHPSGASTSFAQTAMGTPSLLRQLLLEPESPYSATDPQPAMTNAIWWPEFLSLYGDDATTASVLHDLQWQLGLTKARPGIELTIDAATADRYRGVQPAANALKAGIDADILWQARNMNPRPTIAAVEALALQLLRDQMATVPEAQWSAMAIQPERFKRYMQARSPDKLRDDDLAYLSQIAQAAIASPHATLGAGGKAQLPGALRVARTAAAYKDTLSYFSFRGYCINSEPDPVRPRDITALDYNSPLCFVAATDRGVHEWYLGEMRLEHSRARIHENTKDGFSRAMMMLGLIMPAMDLATLVEFSEATVASELAVSSSISEAEADEAISRSAQLTCGLRKP